ncbi:MAG: hypothetical protein AAF693_13660 [Bacteroidota bacterium]
MSHKLDDIDKKNIYKVPNDYFDKLPGIIQARAIEENKKKGFVWSVSATKYAVPALLVVILSGYYAFFNSEAQPQTASEILAEIETDDLVEYLAFSEMSTDEILESVELDEIDFEFDSEETDLLNDSDLGDLEYVMDEFLEINEL